MSYSPEQKLGHTDKNFGAEGNSTLYVGDLDLAVTESQLFEFFSQMGSVARIDLRRRPDKERAYAKVAYHSAESAKRALDKLNFKKVENCEVRLMLSQPDTSLRRSGLGNLFVKNLDSSIDNRSLLEAFSVYGDILSSKVATGPAGESLGFGFVHFKSPDDAEKAIKSAHKIRLVGRQIRVTEFVPRTEREAKDSPFTNVYVKNYDRQRLDCEAAIAAAFAPFGEVTSVFLPRHDDGRPRGFFFVNFAAPSAARAAVEALAAPGADTSAFSAPGSPERLYARQALSRRQRSRELTLTSRRFLHEIDEATAGRNVFVKNLPESVDAEWLGEAFGRVAAVERAKVALGEDGRTRCYGFVLFCSPQDAAAAIKQLHGTLWEGKKLYVALWQRKEVRRMQRAAAARRSAAFAASGQAAVQVATPASAFAFGGALGAGLAPAAAGFFAQQEQLQSLAQQQYMAQQLRLAGYAGQLPPRAAEQRAERLAADQRAVDRLAAERAAAEEGGDERDQLGQLIYQLAQECDLALAGKITGVLLEQDMPSLRELVADEAKLTQLVRVVSEELRKADGGSSGLRRA